MAGKAAVDLGETGEPKGRSEVLFAPLLDRSVMLQFDLRVPLGMAIEEQDDGAILVTERCPASSFGKVEPGDIVCAVTAYREIMVGGSMLSQMMSYMVGKMGSGASSSAPSQAAPRSAMSTTPSARTAPRKAAPSHDRRRARRQRDDARRAA